MKHRELGWLLVVIGVIAVGFYRAGKVDVPDPSPSSSAVAPAASAASPSGEVPRFRGPLSRAQFSLEMTPPYGARLGLYKFHVRGTRDGAQVKATLTRGGRAATADVHLLPQAYRAFFDRLEDRGVWTLRSNAVETHRDRTRYEVYVQAADWTHRAVFCDTGDDRHVAAFLRQGLAGTLLAEQYVSLQNAISPDVPDLHVDTFPPVEPDARPGPPSPPPSDSPAAR